MKRAIVNIKNLDNQCFKWSVLSALHDYDTKHPDRSLKKLEKIEHGLDFSCITFPTSLTDIPTFEKKNSIAINVYGYDDKSGAYLLQRHRWDSRLSNAYIFYYCTTKSKVTIVGSSTSLDLWVKRQLMEALLKLSIVTFVCKVLLLKLR